MPYNIEDIFIPRTPDFMKQPQENAAKGLNKTEKYANQVLSHDYGVALGGKYKTVGGTLSYYGLKNQQKTRFIAPTQLSEYFTYYCYEIHQFCGVNTPKYRYGNIKYQSGDQTQEGHAQVSSLIPSDKIPLTQIEIGVEHRGVHRELKVLELDGTHQVLTPTAAHEDEYELVEQGQKISGNFFAAHLLGFLVQNGDMGHKNGYFISRNNREHFIVIDMGEAKFHAPNGEWQIAELLDPNEGRGFEQFAQKDQLLAVAAKINDLIKPGAPGQLSNLEKIYYNPRAIQMYFELAPKLAADLLASMAMAAYAPASSKDRVHFKQQLSSIIADFEKKVESLTLAAPKTPEGMRKLCADIRALAMQQQKAVEALCTETITPDRQKTFIEQAQNPIYSPDIQIEEIKKNGQAILKHYAPGDALTKFQQRELERSAIAAKVISRLNIKEPQKSAVKEYMMEDLRGPYYQQVPKEQLVDVLERDFRKELGLPELQPSQNAEPDNGSFSQFIRKIFNM